MRALWRPQGGSKQFVKSPRLAFGYAMSPSSAIGSLVPSSTSPVPVSATEAQSPTSPAAYSTAGPGDVPPVPPPPVPPPPVPPPPASLPDEPAGPDPAAPPSFPEAPPG